MIDYVLGFVFDVEDPDLVVLIRKDRPEWQAGLLNGVGGKVEWERSRESPYTCMVREAQEEIGLYGVDWDLMGALIVPEGRVFLYRTSAYVYELKQMESEELQVWDYRRVSIEDSIQNLPWLLPFARHFGREHGESYIEVRYDTGH